MRQSVVKGASSRTGGSLAATGSPPPTIEHLIQLLYAAPFDERGWGAFLEEFAMAVNAPTGQGLGATDLQSGRVWHMSAVRMDPSWMHTYDAYYGSKNIFFERGRGVLKPGIPLPGSAVCLGRDLEGSEFYNDYMRPQDMHHTLGVSVFDDGRTLVHLGSVRPKGVEDFGERELAVFRAIVPHLTSAIPLYLRFQELEARADGPIQVLNELPYGVILIGEAGRVTEHNSRASALLRQSDGISLRHGELAACHADENSRLRSLVMGAVQTAGGRGIAPGGALRISRPSCRRPYVVIVTPLSVEKRIASPKRPCAVVFVRDPDEETRPHGDLLQRLFGLTAAEARVAAVLMEGEDLRVVAERMGITVATARTHLKRIFSKTGAKRQAQLVRLLLRVALP